MAVTFENIKFYHPHSLPARPITSTSFNNRSTPFLYLSKRVNLKLSIHSSSLISFPQAALHHTLPSRPPAVVSSIHSSERIISPITSSTSNAVHTNSACSNDFDRAFGDFSVVEGEKNEEKESLVCLPVKGDEDDDSNSAHATSSDRRIAVECVSSAFTAKVPLKPAGNADLSQPPSQGQTELQEQASDVTPILLDQGLSPRCIPETATSVPVLKDSTLSDIPTLSSASGSTTVSPGQSQQTLPTGIPQQLEPRRSSSPIKSIESQDILEDFMLATSYLSEEFSNSLQNEAACLSSSPSQPVVIPTLSHCLDPLQGSPDWSASYDQSHCASQVAEDPDVSVSDNENDAEHVDNIDRDESSEHLRPVKRLKRSHILDTISSTSQETVPQLSSESPFTRQPESPQQEANPESESIPVQSFLKLRCIGSEVVYCLELFQSHFSSSFVGGKTEGIRQSLQNGHSTVGARFSPEEDALIVELKNKNFSWDMIEDQFAQRFPYRSKSSLQVHYCTKLKGSTKRSRKRQVKSCR